MLSLLDATGRKAGRRDAATGVMDVTRNRSSVGDAADDAAAVLTLAADDSASGERWHKRKTTFLSVRYRITAQTGMPDSTLMLPDSRCRVFPPPTEPSPTLASLTLQRSTTNSTVKPKARKKNFLRQNEHYTTIMPEWALTL